MVKVIAQLKVLFSYRPDNSLEKQDAKQKLWGKLYKIIFFGKINLISNKNALEK